MSSVEINTDQKWGNSVFTKFTDQNIPENVKTFFCKTLFLLQEFTKQLLHTLHENPDEYTNIIKTAAAANLQNSIRGYERASFVPKKDRLKVERARKRFQNTGSKRHHQETRSKLRQHLIDEDGDSDDGSPISHDWTVEHQDEDSKKKGDIKHIVIKKIQIKDSAKQNQNQYRIY